MRRGLRCAAAILVAMLTLSGTSGAGGVDDEPAPLVDAAGGVSSGAGRPGRPSPARPEPALVARVDELRRLATPPALPTDRAARFAFVGDSVAETLGPAVAAEAARRGAQTSVITQPGCGLLPGLPTTPEGFIPPWTRACEQAIPGWRRQIAGSPADVVVVLSTWDGSGRTLDGVLIDPGTLTGRQATVDLFGQLVEAIAPAGSGRSVVFLAEAVPAPGAVSGDASASRIAEARRHRSVLRSVARADPARVRVIDLGQWLCSLGPPCPATIDGVATRGDDGGHFTPDGAAWLAPRLLDALGLPAG